MGVAGGVDHGAARVGLLGGQEHRPGDVVQGGDPVVQVLVRLVQRAPADDRRVGVVAFQRFQPLGDVARVGTLVVVADPGLAAPVAELAPDEVAEPVGVVEVALLEHLLVQPGAVEAGPLPEFDVAHEVAVGGGGHQTVRVVPLVQHQPLEHRLPVDQHPLAVDGDRAQARVGRRLVDDPARRVEELEPHVVEVRVGR